MMTQPTPKRTFIIIAAGVVALYLTLGLISAMTKRPWSDEGWFANPAFNLATKGWMGTTVIEPGGFLEGINQQTYWVMPLHLLTQAACYKAFGFSLLSLRAISLIWGLVALAAWFSIMNSLSGNRRVALLAVALVALDYIFINLASFGRMDMMCAALGFSALAAYLHLRERNFTLAVFISQCLAVASGMTHHQGVLAFMGLIFLTIYFDRRRISWRHIALAAVPYLAGAAGWGLYILENPSLFLSQFSGNATVGGRLAGLTAPLSAFEREITIRYLIGFGLGGHSWGHSSVVMLKGLILAAYVGALIGAISTREIRQHKGYRALLILWAIYFLVMTIFDGQKLYWYLIHIVPLYAAILAVWLDRCWERRRRLFPRWAIACSVVGLIVLQVGGVVQRASMDTYHRSYLPAVNYLKSNVDKTSLIMGSAELGFGLGFPENLVDDTRLGYYSGRKPDYIVIDEIYEDAFEGVQITEPDAYQHIADCLTRQYRQVYNQGFYQIYARDKETFAALPHSGESAGEKQ